MTYAAPPPLAYRITVGTSIRRAYRSLRDNWRLALLRGYFPFVVVLISELVTEAGTGQGIWDWIARLVFVLFSLIFIVRWHRFVLLGEIQGNTYFQTGFGTYIFACIKLFLPAIAMLTLLVILIDQVSSFLISSLGVVALRVVALGVVALGVVGLIVLFFLLLRFFLIFPAAAILRPITLRAAWDLLGGNYWRLFRCVVACELPFLAVSTIIQKIGSALAWPMVFAAIAQAVTFAGYAVTAALLSDVFRGVTGGAPGGIAGATD